MWLWLDSVTGVHWHSPWFLALLPLPVLVLLVGWRRPPPSVKLSTLADVPAPRRRAALLRLPLALEFLGVLALVLALARPQLGIAGTQRRPPGVDLVVALDVSGSMDAVDLPRDVLARPGPGGERLEVALDRWLKDADGPESATRQAAAQQVVQLLEAQALRSRLAIAKSTLAAFIERRPNDRIGLLTFASDSFTVCPPTLDHEFLLARLHAIKTGILDDTSTRLAPPLAAGVARLRDLEPRRRVMLLFTDGENVRPAAITPLEAAQLAASQHIAIHTIGVGSRFGFVPQPNFFGQRNWLPIKHFNPELLQDVARTTGGQYFAAADEAGMARVMQEIDQLEKTPRERGEYTEYRELFPVLLALGLALIVLGFIAESTVLLRVP